MKTVAVYNNKGGVGKSTVTLFLADFFSSLKIAGRKARVLVMDFDGQASSAISLLGLNAVAKTRSEKCCLSHLLLRAKNGKQQRLGNYLKVRKKGYTTTRKIPLGEMSVMTTERDSTIKLENSCDHKLCVKFAGHLKRSLSGGFDMAFVDLPANIDERNKLALTGLLLSDHILIPTESSRISLNSLGDTFGMIQYLRGMVPGNCDNTDIIGILLNKTDRRTKQYRRHNKELSDLAANHNTVVFKNFLPSAPALSTASDDSIGFSTLKERYSTHYDHVRKVAMELAEKCGYAVKRKKKG